jgi:hypothetical protein
LSLGWVASGKAGVSTNYSGIVPFSGNYFGYVIADTVNVWQMLERNFTNGHPGAHIYGRVGFYDADYFPYLDEGQLMGQVSFNQGGDVTVIKSWTAATAGSSIFRGWESFDAVVPSDGEVTIRVRVRNIGDLSFSSAVVLDHISVCPP